MEISIYAKRRIGNSGPFYVFLTTLPKKDGTDQTVTVKFRDECGNPKPENCPMNIIVEKSAANVSKKTYTDKNGMTGTRYVMWVSAWKPGSPFEDKSMDEFDI